MNRIHAITGCALLLGGAVGCVHPGLHDESARIETSMAPSPMDPAAFAGISLDESAPPIAERLPDWDDPDFYRYGYHGYGGAYWPLAAPLDLGRGDIDFVVKDPFGSRITLGPKSSSGKPGW